MSGDLEGDGHVERDVFALSFSAERLSLAEPFWPCTLTTSLKRSPLESGRSTSETLAAAEELIEQIA